MPVMKRRGGLIVGALIQGVHDRDAQHFGRTEGLSDQVLNQRNQRSSRYKRVLFYGLNDLTSDCGVGDLS